ncbi:transporter substrate-binding domain-containing protein [Corynebacterium choanae]|uniref:ABC transporter glutamine-binding protein GlnH n=1 Tax=Corynebacterium choanae TaxID=1862358 RepID=A0A3G6J3U8_9CORY|nr:transporter substrate-binding domain-containing protein [Corynebacterium choanae]AZA12687.1 ABC transporter glutamine-binding protein GlnH precursor [Corynebacterium choanae]
MSILPLNPPAAPIAACPQSVGCHRRTRQLLAVLTGISVAVAGCGQTTTPPLAVPTFRHDPTTTQPNTPPIDLQNRPDTDFIPLPPGARTGTAGLLHGDTTNDRDWQALAEQTGYQGRSIAPGDFTPQQRVPQIVRRGRIIIGVQAGQYLLSYRNPATGELTGFEIDIAHEIARDIFGDPGAVEFRFVDASSWREQLAAGSIDMVFRSLSITPQRETALSFSAPYLRSNTRLLVPKSSPITDPDSLGDTRVCVRNDSTPALLARTAREVFPLLMTNNWADCLVAMQQSQADAIFADDTVLAGLAAQDPHTHIVGTPVTEEFYGAAFPASSSPEVEGLIAQVNATIERMRREGTLAALANTWFGEYFVVSPLPAPVYREAEAHLPAAPEPQPADERAAQVSHRAASPARTSSPDATDEKDSHR